MKSLDYIGSSQFWLIISGATIGCDSGDYLTAAHAALLLICILTAAVCGAMFGYAEGYDAATNAENGATTKD